jgi:hypothetical protein
MGAAHLARAAVLGAPVHRARHSSSDGLMPVGRGVKRRGPLGETPGRRRGPAAGAVIGSRACASRVASVRRPPAPTSKELSHDH